jgi:DNA polymerase (family 10)
MTNKEIAQILYNISEYLAMQDVPFKPRAFEKAAASIESLEQDLSEIYKKGGVKALEEIESIGKGIAERIEELLKTGKIKDYEVLKKKIPVRLEELSIVEGVGPKTIFKLYKKLGIKNLKDLEKAAKASRIRKIDGFGAKSEENILLAIEFLKKSKGRFPLGYILYDIRRIEQRIRALQGVKKAIIAGSIRRMKETIGDADLLVAVSSAKFAKRVMDYFVDLPERGHVYSHGPTRSSIRLKSNIDCDLRVVAQESFGAALQYFTGNKDHNIELRKIAMEKGLKLNEYGLFKIKSQKSKVKSEEEIYKAMGMQWIAPELRENNGEIEAALRQAQGKPGGLPDLIDYHDLKGDLQMHSNWSDGANTIEQLAEKAMAMGLEYIAITDHLRGTFSHNNLNEKKAIAQWKEIDGINAKLKVKSQKFKVLKGCEVDILNDGRLFANDELLKKFDIVGASVHQNFKMPKGKMTERIIRAMKNPNVDILFHPTGRLLGLRPAYEVDIEKIIRAAKETKTILEHNAYFTRLDLKDEYLRMAKENGVKVAIDSDSHSIAHFPYLELGIAQARKGWLEKKDVINAWPVEKMLKMLK